jgi:hypothetical protein
LDGWTRQKFTGWVSSCLCGPMHGAHETVRFGVNALKSCFLFIPQVREDEWVTRHPRDALRRVRHYESSDALLLKEVIVYILSLQVM